MKKYTISLALLVFILASGCTKDYLDKQNKNQLPENAFWKTADQAQQGITATYAALHSATGDKWTWFEQTYISATYKSDEIMNNKTQNYGIALHGYTYTTDESTMTNLWAMCFAGINRANQCIENIPGVPGDAQNAQTGISDAARKSLIAEAKFLRAHFYLTLINYFQNIPLVTATPKTNADYYPKEAAPADIWAQIENDLKAAKADLPPSREGEELGRVSSYTAQAYLGKVYLFQEKFDLAQAEFTPVIANPALGLLDHFEDNFNGLQENSKESLFEIQFSADRSNGNDMRTPMSWEVSSSALDGWELFYPSPWLVDELKTDKQTDGSYSDRVYGTMFFDDPKSVAPMVDVPGMIVNYADVKAGLDYPVFFKKYTLPTDLADNGSYTGININLMRMADVYLMQAETLNELNQTGDATLLVNQVRARSHAAPLGSMTQSQLRTQIRHHERPCELSMEYCIRWPDLYRWARSKVAPEPIKSTLVAHQQEFAGNFINGKHDIYPVPLSEISKNPNIHQVSVW
ncbi:RagB/SusD family nutrient uptake outer membrane protein [Flavitalea flava]